MSSPPANDLKRLLLGSAIGAAIGLVLLALGVALLWNAADQRLTEAAPPPLPEANEGRPASSPASSASSTASSAGAMTYPALPAPVTPPPAPLPEEPPQAARPSLWGSIFDTEDEAAASRSTPPAARPAPRPSTPRPSTARPSTPRRAPEPERQEDSLFF